MSSFLGAGGTSGFNLDRIKPTSSSSGCSSTLSKSSSVSSLAIPTKRARAPRKRPNQSYMEAATLLSAACPNVFPIKNLCKKRSDSLSSSSSGVFPPFPVLNEADFLIEEPSPDRNPSFQFKLKPVSLVEGSRIALREASPPSSPDYDVDSIFDDECGEGIDSIMGKLSMNDSDSNSNPNNDPYIGPMGFGVGGKFGLGPRFGHRGNNIRQAMRGAHNEGLWRQMPMVQMKDIVPKFNALPSLQKKKTKKKKKKVEDVKDEFEVIKTTSAGSTITTASKLERGLKSGLGLKLNHEEVIKAWGDRGFPFSCDSGTPESSDDIASTLAEIDLFPDMEGGGMREASVLRYREKRRTRLFSKKIRYQVRKVNADCKPRMKGRFVKRTNFLQGATEEESQ